MTKHSKPSPESQAAKFKMELMIPYLTQRVMEMENTRSFKWHSNSTYDDIKFSFCIEEVSGKVYGTINTKSAKFFNDTDFDDFEIDFEFILSPFKVFNTKISVKHLATHWKKIIEELTAKRKVADVYYSRLELIKEQTRIKISEAMDHQLSEIEHLDEEFDNLQLARCIQGILNDEPK